MAERAKTAGHETSAAEQAAEDLMVMFPDQMIPIGGQTIIVHEYPYMQWIELKPLCLPIIEVLSAFTGQENIVIDDLIECFEDHIEQMQILYCKSIQQPPEFLSTLKADEMELLMVTWWAVNKHFFLKSVGRLLRKKNKHQPSDGQTSSSA